MIVSLRSLVAATALCLGVPAFAQVPEIGDGIINIVDDPEVTQGDFYAQVRDWAVFSGSTDEGFGFCAAELEQPGLTWRFGYDNSPQWQIAIKHRFSGETAYGVFDVDGRQSGISGWGTGEWVILWPNRGEYDAIANGNRMEIRLGDIWYEFQLKGTKAAALKVQECVQNRGNPELAAAPARPSAPAPRSNTSNASAAGAPRMPDPTRRGEEFVGNCTSDYAVYRCMSATLSPTVGNARAELVYDMFGSEPSYIIQTDKNDVSHVWVSFGGEPYKNVGRWNTDGACRRPMQRQDAEARANLGQDAWKLCME